jgi:two-component system, OmpR family, KDP operon response regulator KdpE
MTAEGARVLIVDDEPQILRALKVVLRNAGWSVETAETAEEASTQLATRPPDVMVLDLVLPDGSGVDVLRELRRWSALPVIVLSAVGDEQEKVRALDAGADDYMTKPFGPEELLARLRALQRRAGDGGSPVVTVGDLEVDVAAHRVTRAGAEIRLTPIEFDLLRVLAVNRDKLVTHAQLLREVWGPQYQTETHYLRVHVANIRAKLEPDPSRPRYVLTEPGIGYRLQAPS